MPLLPVQFEAIKITIQPVQAKRACIAFAGKGILPLGAAVGRL
jgi:hypothetical protein